MKFKTFRALLIGGAAVAGIGAFGGVMAMRDQPKPSPVGRPPTPVAAASATRTPSSTANGAPGLREVDRMALALAGRPAPGGKIKDASPGRPWKINAYQDAGHATVNRLKIDLDRDEKWDEKWSFENGGVKRQVAPADDDRYTEEFSLRDGAWVRAGEGTTVSVTAATPVAATAVAAPPGGEALRDMDSQILARVQKNIAGDKVKDAVPTARWKVNLYKDAGHASVNRLKIDLDRDDKWDEKWTFVREADREEVKRQVAPADDEQYTLEFRLRHGAWAPKTRS